MSSLREKLGRAAGRLRGLGRKLDPFKATASGPSEEAGPGAEGRANFGESLQRASESATRPRRGKIDPARGHEKALPRAYEVYVCEEHLEAKGGRPLSVGKSEAVACQREGCDRVAAWSVPLEGVQK